MKKIFSASILLLGLTSTVLKAGYPPIPNPTKIPDLKAGYPPIPNPTKIPDLVKSGRI